MLLKVWRIFNSKERKCGIFTIFLMIADLMGLNEENESIMEGCKLRWERQGRVINLVKHM